MTGSQFHLKTKQTKNRTTWSQIHLKKKKAGETDSELQVRNDQTADEESNDKHGREVRLFVCNENHKDTTLNATSIYDV